MKLDTSHFHAIVLPTYRCNFRCPYCYEDHKHVDMSKETFAAIKKHLVLRKNNGLKDLCIVFFGGEPTLFKDDVLDLAHFSKDLFSGEGESFCSGMTTNGSLLTFENFKQYYDAGIHIFQITFDGPRETHNLTRIYADGRGTFDLLWKNVNDIRESDYKVKINLRIHVRPETLNVIDDFSKNELAEFRKDPRFEIDYFPLLDLGGNTVKQLELFPTDEAAKKALAPLRSRETYEKPKYCYASNPNSLVFLPNGDLAKCTVALDEGVVGKLLPDGKLQMNNYLFSAWCIGVATNDEEAKRCPRVFLKKAIELQKSGKLS